MEQKKVLKRAKRAPAATTLSAEKVTESRLDATQAPEIDLSDVAALDALPKSALGAVNRAILALKDDERMQVIEKYCAELPELTRPVNNDRSAINSVRPCFGAFSGLIKGVVDLVENDDKIVKFLKTLSPEMAPGEYRYQVFSRRAAIAERATQPDDVNTGFFKIRSSKRRILREFAENKFFEPGILETYFKSMGARR